MGLLPVFHEGGVYSGISTGVGPGVAVEQQGSGGFHQWVWCCMFLLDRDGVPLPSSPRDWGVSDMDVLSTEVFDVGGHWWFGGSLWWACYS